MGYTIGDKVMHPKFGAGQITGEEHRELVGGFKHYYVIQVLGQTATAYVPVSKMDELGVRLIMSLSNLGRILDILRSVPSVLSDDHRERQARVLEQLETGLPILVAEVIRDLTWRAKLEHLTPKDTTLLNQGREQLANEMALATDAGVKAAHAMIDGTLKTALALGFDELETVC
jgi:CarD family transcriptional regulator